MSMTMEDGFERWTAKRTTALGVEIVRGRTTAFEAPRSFDPAPSKTEVRVEGARVDTRKALRANPLDIGR
jgi:polyisoprenoid-binding protein YceI